MKPSLRTLHRPAEEDIDPQNIWCTTYCGIPTTQAWDDYLLWEKFFYHNPINFMLEIGTQFGATSLFFKHHAEVYGFDFLTIDIVEFPEVSRIKELLGGSFHLMDCFTAETIQIVTSVDTPKLVFCDGGNKPLEMQTYAPLLKPGDFIACHDWMSEVGPADLTGLPIEEIKFEKKNMGNTSWTAWWRIIEHGGYDHTTN